LTKYTTKSIISPVLLQRKGAINGA